MIYDVGAPVVLQALKLNPPTSFDLYPDKCHPQKQKTVPCRLTRNTLLTSSISSSVARKFGGYILV